MNADSTSEYGVDPAVWEQGSCTMAWLAQAFWIVLMRVAIEVKNREQYLWIVHYNSAEKLFNQLIT